MNNFAQQSQAHHPLPLPEDGPGDGERNVGAGFKTDPTTPGPPYQSLILVGVVHGDPQGYERAWRLLEQVQPDLITVEISHFSLRYRLRQGPRWQRLLKQALKELPLAAPGHLAIRRLSAQVGLPFEVRTARDWSKAYGIPWRPLDLGRTARRELPRYGRELLHPDNLRALLAAGDEADGSLADFVAAEFRRARLAYRRSPRRLFFQNNQEKVQRERFLARRLHRLALQHQRVVHLGGWEHLVPWQDREGLWHELAHLQPLRWLLDDAGLSAAGKEE